MRFFLTYLRTSALLLRNQGVTTVLVVLSVGHYLIVRLVNHSVVLSASIHYYYSYR